MSCSKVRAWRVLDASISAAFDWRLAASDDSTGTPKNKVPRCRSSCSVRSSLAKTVATNREFVDHSFSFRLNASPENGKRVPRRRTLLRLWFVVQTLTSRTSE